MAKIKKLIDFKLEKLFKFSRRIYYFKNSKKY